VTIASFRFYAELNNFLGPHQRQRRFDHPCARDASVKHMIEALGVPHTEVGMILVNGSAVGFGHRLGDGDAVSVYPAFSRCDVGTGSLLRSPPSGGCRFVADAHLGLLARQLRMLGFDALYRNDYRDAEVAEISAAEDRIVLTRDRDLLIRKEIVHGCYLHATACPGQVTEVLVRYRLARAARVFTRCLDCNGVLHGVPKAAVAHRVPAASRQVYERFYECTGCAKVYWEGSHVQRMRQQVQRLLGAARLQEDEP
jgi:uncharacterized protein with PIN domain